MEALKRRPHQVPMWTKQQILDRGYEAWCGVRHESCVTLRSNRELHRILGLVAAAGGQPCRDSGAHYRLVCYHTSLVMYRGGGPR